MPLKLNLAIPNKAVHAFIGLVVVIALVVGVYAYTFPGGFIGHGGDNVWINTAGGETTLQTAIDNGLLGADDDWEKVGGGEPVLADNMYHTGNVGIGTTSPSQKLEVNGNLKLSTANPYIYSGGSYIVIPNGLYVSGGTGYFQNTLMARNGIQNDGSADSGYVRIKDSLLVDSWLRTSGATGWYNQTYGGGWYMADSTWIRSYGNKNIYHNTGILRTDGTFQVGPSGNRFIVNTSGNVGIGTTNPSQKLDVAGYVKGQTGLCVGNDCRTAWPAAGTGDITAVNPGTGLTGGGTSGAVTLNADTSYLQRRVTGTCASNQAIRVINNNGTVSCVALPSSALCTWSGNTYSTGYFCWNGTTCSVSVPGSSCECKSDGTWECNFHFSGHPCPVLCGK